MEEVLKKIYVKIKFVYKKFIKKEEKILQIEREFQEKRKEIDRSYIESLKVLESEKEKKFLENHIDYNLNSYRLIKYKNKYYGERCFIIGNGPSLKANDLEKIKGEYSFGANKIFKIFTETNWRPTYLFVEDSLIYEYSYEDYRNLPNIPKFVSSIALDWTELPLLRNGIKFFDYLYYYDIYPKSPPLTVDLTKELWCVYNVGYQMLNAAIYMGFKEIYLLGMDFDYDFSKDKELGENGELEVSGKVVNHFSKDYLDPGERTHHTDTKYALKGFELIESNSKNLGVKIYNATRGGKLEVFERVNFDTVENLKDGK